MGVKLGLSHTEGRIRLRVFEKMVSRMIFWSSRGEVIGEWRRLHSEELFNLCLSPNTRWFKYDRDDLCVNKSQFVPAIFEPPCINEAFEKLYFGFCYKVSITASHRTCLSRWSRWQYLLLLYPCFPCCYSNEDNSLLTFMVWIPWQSRFAFPETLHFSSPAFWACSNQRRWTQWSVMSRKSHISFLRLYPFSHPNVSHFLFCLYLPHHHCHFSLFSALDCKRTHFWGGGG